MSTNLSKQQLILLIGPIAVVVIILVWAILPMINPPPPPEEPVEEKTGPIYEVVAGDVKFKLKEVKDRGSTLKASENRYPPAIREDLVTTERFIEVTVAAQNIGKEDIPYATWEVRGLIDSQGRNFSSSNYLDTWTSEDNACFEALKPVFTPTLCTKIYEVAKVATGLQVEVFVREEDPDFIDLGI